MPTPKNHTTPSGIQITFDPDQHLYSDSRGLTYDSITRVVKSLFLPFNLAAISARVAARDGISPADVQRAWAAKSIAACRMGTRVHAVAEAALLNQDPIQALRDCEPQASRGQPSANQQPANSQPGDDGVAEPESDRERAAMDAAFRAATEIREQSEFVAPEQIVADPKSLTAGTMDCFAMRRDGAAVILDWKTNERIEVTNKFGGRALPPYNHLYDCNLVHYSLQLHLYRWIMLRAGYMAATGGDVVDLAIAWLAPGRSDAQWITVIDLSSEADQIMRGRRAHAEQVRDWARRCEQAEADARIPAEMVDK